MTELFENGYSYSSLNVARGALSSLGLAIEGISVGKHALVIRYMKGVFNLRRPEPKYVMTWDVNKVLNYLRSLSPVKYITLKELTLKLTMLISLTNASRVQSIHLMDLNFVQKVKGNFIFVLNDLIKQSRPGYKEPTVNITAYPPDRRLCTVTVYNEYLFRTKNIRRNKTKLLLSYIKPHECVSRDTISRWIKEIMTRSKIDTGKYKAHSVRSASVSKAASTIPVSQIIAKAGWTNASTFAKYYHKKIERQDADYAAAVLKD